MEYKCSHCKILKAEAEFAPSQRRNGSWCRACFKAKYQNKRKALISRNIEAKRKRLNRPGLTQYKCEWCGSAETTYRRNPRFCSQICRDRHRHQLEKAERLASKQSRSCLTCGAVIGPERRSDACFCSDKCNSSSHAVTRKFAKRAKSVKPSKKLSRFSIGERDGWQCGICGGSVDMSLKHPDPMFGSIDHIVPLSLGGSNDLSNLQLAHLVCNLRKGGSGPFVVQGLASV